MHRVQRTMPLSERSGDPTRRSVRLTHPALMLAVGSALSLLPAALSTSDQHLRWRSHWYLTQLDLAEVFAGCLTVGIGLALGLWRRPAPPKEETKSQPTTVSLGRAANTLFVLYLIGYATWTISAVAHGMTIGLAVDTIRGHAGAADLARRTLVTVAGVSTLTEVGPVLVALLAILWRRDDRRYAMVTAIVALSIARAFLNSERISLIMIAIPALVASALAPEDPGYSARSPRRPSRRLLTRAAIIVGPLGLLGWFAITERGRSWNGYYSTRFNGGLLAFSFDRITAYYATATNNGAIWKAAYAPFSTYPELSLQWLAKAPLVGHLVGFHTDGDARWMSTLAAYSNPEFNNPGTFLPLIGELGPFCVLLFLLWGFAMGRIYSAATRGSTIGVVGYAGLCVGLLELPRYPYYCSSRVVVACLALYVLHLTTRTRPERFDR